VVEFAGRVSDCGTVSAELLLLKPIVVRLAGALVSAKVHVLDPAPEIDVGLQVNDVIDTAEAESARLTVWDTPFSVAVTITVAFTDPLLLAGN